LDHVGGSGERYYPIRNGEGLVEAAFAKEDYSGGPLTVSMYRNGASLYSRTVTAPKGSVDFIVDGKTGSFPVTTPVPTSATGLVIGKVYRY
jgi:hypothetical protein